MSNQNVNNLVGNCRVLLWSVIGLIRSVVDDDVDMLCDIDPHTGIVPAHQDDPFMSSSILLQLLNKIDLMGNDYWTKSVCVRHNVDSVPPRPHPNGLPEGSEERKNLQLHINRLLEFTPVCILPVNPASNEGNCRLLRHVISQFENDLSEIQAEDGQRRLPHRIYLSDVNIYPRVMQVGVNSFIHYLFC